MTSPGYLILSLDTELSLGYFDIENSKDLFSKDGETERAAIRSVLALCEQYNIAATWAITGYIFYQRNETPLPCGLEQWCAELQRFASSFDTTSPIVAGADIVQEILESPQRKEIGFHGYSHRPFKGLDAAEAQFELQAWQKLADRLQIHGTSVVFPRNAVAHLDEIKKAGFTCYRGHDRIPRISEIFPFLEVLDHLVPVSKLPLYEIDAHAIDPNGLVNLRGSQHLVHHHPGAEKWLLKHNLHKRRLKRIYQGIDVAAAEGKIIHLWAHPWEFRNESTLQLLEEIFAYAATILADQSLLSVTMTEMAHIVQQKAG